MTLTSSEDVVLAQTLAAATSDINFSCCLKNCTARSSQASELGVICLKCLLDTPSSSIPKTSGIYENLKTTSTKWSFNIDGNTTTK